MLSSRSCVHHVIIPFTRVHFPPSWAAALLVRDLEPWCRLHFQHPAHGCDAAGVELLHMRFASMHSLHAYTSACNLAFYAKPQPPLSRCPCCAMSLCRTCSYSYDVVAVPQQCQAWTFGACSAHGSALCTAHPLGHLHSPRQFKPWQAYVEYSPPFLCVWLAHPTKPITVWCSRGTTHLLQHALVSHPCYVPCLMVSVGTAVQSMRQTI
jgi:hypothetical protein